MQCHKLSIISLNLSGEQYCVVTSEERVVRVLPTGTNTARTDCTINVLSTFNPKWVQNRNKGKAFWLSFVVEYDNIFLNFGKSIISSIQDLGLARHLRVVFWDLRVIMGSGKAWMLCYLNNYLGPACFLHQCGSAPSYPRPGVLTGFLENNN